METVKQRGYTGFEELSFGGEGRIFLCEQSGQTYLLKVVARMDEEGLAILNEIAEMENSHLPRFKEIFSDEHSTYIVREYIEGTTLEKLIKREKQLPYQRSKEIILALCSALKAFHSATPTPLIHRDLKPGNIIITPQWDVKLIDFGIARRHKKEAVRDTVLAGTMGYTAPEVMAGIQSDARSDIYSLGLILYEMLSGKSLLDPPYQIRPLCESGADAPKALDRIIQKAANINQIFRYSTLDELIKAIEHAGRVKPSRIITAVAAVLAVSAAAIMLLRATARPAQAGDDGMASLAGAALTPYATQTIRVSQTPQIRDYVGQDIDAACAELGQTGVYPTVYSIVSADYARGRIIAQNQHGGDVIFTVSAGPPMDKVAFEDAGLEKIVKTLLGIPQNEDVSSKQMEALTALDGYADGIHNLTSLSGLEYAVNLDTLCISGCAVTDISPIQNLGKLEQLRIYTCQITDISGMARLRNLKRLNIDENYITDISALAGIRLIDFSMGHNSVADISALQSSDGLTFLSIRSNQITDISVISDCKNLLTLWADDNHITDLRPLSGMDQLREVELCGNDFNDLSPLEGLGALKYINLTNVGVIDYSPLLSCGALTEVVVGSGDPLDEATRAALEGKGIRVTVNG
jgi:predicted Ser/Thr protein kinase